MKHLKEIKNWKELKNEVVYGDCLKGMKLIPDKAVQLLIFDPPYFEIKGDFDFVFSSKDEWVELNKRCAKEFKRILADNGSLYVFGHSKKIAYQQVVYDEFFKLENSLVWEKCDSIQYQYYSPDIQRSFNTHNERLLFYSNEVEKTGLEEIKDNFGVDITPFGKIITKNIKKNGITNKDVARLFPSKTGGLTGCVSNWINGQNIPTPCQWGKICSLFNIKNEYEHLRNEYEHLRRPWSNNKKLTDVLKYSQESNVTRKFHHPTQKPPKLIEDLIQCSSREGDLILDPMMGSWTTARACKDLGRDFIGFEISEEYCKIGIERLRQQVLF